MAAIKQQGLSDDRTEAAGQLLELVAALGVHDRITRGHAERVRAYSRMIGEELGLSGDDLEKLHWAGLLHDVGKLFVPEEILNKPGQLTSDEFEIVKQHPGWGAELCEPLRGWLGDWVDAVAQHHERWDGAGYPRGLAGDDIALSARIVSVADVFDVMTSARSYQQPVSVTRAREELVRCSGTQFDARMVRAFLSISLGRLRLAMGPLASLAHLPSRLHIPAAGLGTAATGLVTAGALLFGGVLEPSDAPVDPATATANLAIQTVGSEDRPWRPVPRERATADGPGRPAATSDRTGSTTTTTRTHAAGAPAAPPAGAVVGPSSPSTTRPPAPPPPPPPPRHRRRRGGSWRPAATVRTTGPCAPPHRPTPAPTSTATATLGSRLRRATKSSPTPTSSSTSSGSSPPPPR